MRILLIALCLLISVAAFAKDVTIFGAASVTNAMNELIATYKKETGKNVIASYASSGPLAKQIENGAPADIFISANMSWMDYLVEKGKIEEGTNAPYLANKLAFIAPVSSKTDKIEHLDGATVKKLIGSGKFAMGDPEHVPAGKYTKKALEGMGIWNDIEGQAARMQDVRATLAMVERAVPYGFVYFSDSAISDKVKVLALVDDSLTGKITYPMAIVKDKRTSEVEAFYNFLKTDYAAGVFLKYGFIAVK